MLTWNVGVERHDAQRVLLDRIVKKPGARQVAFAGERLAHALARIVVVGDDEDRHYERCQDRPQMLVFGGRAVVDEIAGDDGHIGSRCQSVELDDCLRQAGSGVDAAPIGSGAKRGGLLWRVEQLPRRQDMRIRNLSDEHHRPFLIKTKFTPFARAAAPAQTGRSPSIVTRCITRRWPW